MSGLSKMLMMVGGIVFFIGFLMQFMKIGRLPGDILIKKGNMTFYFPIATSILLSVLLSALFYFLSRFSR
jgi:predicted phosphohydrolase